MNKDTIKLTGFSREGFGKGHSRKLRKTGLIPAIICSKEKKTECISINLKELTKALLENKRRNTLFCLEIMEKDGVKTVEAMVKDLQKNPVSREAIHVDFIEIKDDGLVDALVSINLVGKSKSVTAGGKFEALKRKINIRCLPKEIPEKIDLDITDLPFGTTFAENIALPKKTILIDKSKLPIITIKRSKGEKTEEAPAPK